MNPEITSSDARTDLYAKHNLRQEVILDSFLSETQALISQLHSKLRGLPRVDNQGRSECPFAEDLFSAKEQVAEKLGLRLKPLLEYRTAVEQEVERTRRNLAVLSDGAHALHSSDVATPFRKAEFSQEAEARRAADQLHRIQEMIPAVERALQIAATKRFPGRKPRPPVPHGGTPSPTAGKKTLSAAPAPPPADIKHFGSSEASTLFPSPGQDSKKGLDPGLRALLSMNPVHDTVQASLDTESEGR
jgi:hypothetical protein